MISPESLQYLTVRIDFGVRRGSRSLGTGFFVEFDRGSDGTMPVLVTSRQNAWASSSFQFKLFVAKPPEQGLHVDQYAVLSTSYSVSWIFHPEDKVDLAVLPMGPVFERMRAIGLRPFVRSIAMGAAEPAGSMTPEPAAESFFIVSNPPQPTGGEGSQAIPCIQKAYSASSPEVDFNARPEFLIEGTSQPGSSGSPVFRKLQSGVVNTTQVPATKWTNKLAGLVGVFSEPLQLAGMQSTHQAGKGLQAAGHATFQGAAAFSKVIQARKILDFDAELRRRGLPLWRR